ARNTMPAQSATSSRKKNGSDFLRAARNQTTRSCQDLLKDKLRLQLQHARRTARFKLRTQNARRRTYRRQYLPEIRARRVVHGQAKIRMVEHIERLHADSQLRAVPSRNSREFHQRRVRVDVPRPAEDVPLARRKTRLCAHVELRSAQTARPR